jgi:hypothetical protein
MASGVRDLAVAHHRYDRTYTAVAEVRFAGIGLADSASGRGGPPEPQTCGDSISVTSDYLRYVSIYKFLVGCRIKSR